MHVIFILLHVVSLFAFWSALVAASIITATDAGAFTERQYGNWTYMEATIGDDFEGTRASVFWGPSISKARCHQTETITADYISDIFGSFYAQFLLNFYTQELIESLEM